VALVEQVIGHLNRSRSPVPPPVLTRLPGLTELRIRGGPGTGRSILRVENTGPISIQLKQDARTSFETLAAIAGLHVRFDARFQSGVPRPLQLDGVDILDALDHLALQTQNLWKAIDDKTILVAPDIAAVRNEVDSVVMKVFDLTNTATAEQATALVNLARTVLGVSLIQARGSTITVFANPQSIELVDHVISSLTVTR
jgi:hypothetical protein